MTRTMFILVMSVILLTGVGCVTNGSQSTSTKGKTDSEKNSYFFAREYRAQQDVWVLYRISGDDSNATGLLVPVIPPDEGIYEEETIVAAVSPDDTWIVYTQPIDWQDHIYIQRVNGSEEREVVGPTLEKPPTHMSFLDTISWADNEHFYYAELFEGSRAEPWDGPGGFFDPNRRVSLYRVNAMNGEKTLVQEDSFEGEETNPVADILLVPVGR